VWCGGDEKKWSLYKGREVDGERRKRRGLELRKRGKVIRCEIGDGKLRKHACFRQKHGRAKPRGEDPGRQHSDTLLTRRNFARRPSRSTYQVDLPEASRDVDTHMVIGRAGLMAGSLQLLSKYFSCLGRLPVDASYSFAADVDSAGIPTNIRPTSPVPPRLPF